ncbi:hypothetical protein ATANTOWER_008577 [Ataeniobius toweri]|uniref:Uncharacterized protein n=1 Tax=Ataeniobius toweri TaxID=208326 RepID=A0ABU7BEM4_9TELE|nr:hypothetical protein [Ataeniobius toweri]
MVAGRCSEVIEAVMGMLVLLLGESPVSFAAVETYCDGRQDGAQCYGVLGGTVLIKLMDNSSEIPTFNLKKDHK